MNSFPCTHWPFVSLLGICPLTFLFSVDYLLIYYSQLPSQKLCFLSPFLDWILDWLDEAQISFYFYNVSGVWGRLMVFQTYSRLSSCELLRRLKDMFPIGLFWVKPTCRKWTHWENVVLLLHYLSCVIGLLVYFMWP